MLTVLLASHNGASTLSQVLRSYLALQDPPAGWKVVVVDNASNDGTAELVNRFAERLPIELVYEPRRGKNRALNTGLEFIVGDLVVLTDDDTVPRPDWLVQMRRVADEQSAYDIFGGAIDPIWPTAPPDWLFRIVPLGLTFAITPEEVTDGPVPPGLVWGANMAVRTRVFDAGHRFDQAMGPKAGKYRIGGETEFTTRLHGFGYRAWHSSASRVGHIIRPRQMDPKWILERAHRFGRGVFAQQRNYPGPAVPLLFGVPRWAVRRLLEEAAKLIAAKVQGDSERSFAAAWQAQYYLGYLTEARQARRTGTFEPAVPSAGHGGTGQ